MSRPHILIIDDDERIRTLLSRYLGEKEFVVCAACDADEADEALRLMDFDAMIVDVMMPGRTGLEFIQNVRESGNALIAQIPAIFLTALGEVEDRILGLEAGADDYLPKPFEPQELVLRLKAILRRRQGIRKSDAPQLYQVGNWRYAPAENSLLHDDGETLLLTQVENNLLKALASQSGEVVSRDRLAELCSLDAGERTIDVQVTRLRKKIEDNSKAPRYLQTVRGKGYVLKAEAYKKKYGDEGEIN